MAQRGQRKCLCCHDLFLPEPRSAGRQRYCSAAACRRASKAASQAAWLAKAENLDYFAGPMNVLRVQAWRAAHPGMRVDVAVGGVRYKMPCRRTSLMLLIKATIVQRPYTALARWRYKIS